MYYTCTDPILKKSTLEYYQLLKHAFQLRAVTDTKVSISFVIFPEIWHLVILSLCMTV